MRIGALVVFVVASLAIMAVCAYGAFPDSVSGVKLSAETTVVREWERAIGTAGRCFLVVILGHGVPLETVVAGIFFGCG